jgi:hypothetical protein
VQDMTIFDKSVVSIDGGSRAKKLLA